MHNTLFDPRSATQPHRRIFGVFLVLTLLLTGAFLTAATVAAQDTPPASADNVTADEVNEVARELWCPLCSGVRLDACELKACDQMKEVIAIKLGEGENVQSIKDYFVEQYGPQVLGAPPLEGFNWFAWILPFAVLIGGGIFLWFRSRQLVQPVAAEAVSRENVTKSDYERKLDEELKRYG
ncbi:MAG: cytochrome c-type biogenesis protein [Caldilineaceae bacterium]